jgi:uncharacterized protein
VTEILPRLLSPSVVKALSLFPVVAVTGARQTGKSTLVRDTAPLSSRRYITLDTTLNRGLATAEPHTLLGSGDREPVVIDEVQRAPDLLLAIKESVDRQKVKGRFLLTGSANLLLMQRASESLAGRARYLTLWPMTRREQLGQGACGIWEQFFTHERDRWMDVLSAQTAPRERWQSLAARGGYPAAALLNPDRHPDPDRSELFAGYTQTYLERDLRDLAAIDNLYDFQRLMRAACLRLGAVINQVELARDTGLPRTSVQRYLNRSVLSTRAARTVFRQPHQATDQVSEALLERYRPRAAPGPRGDGIRRPLGERHLCGLDGVARNGCRTSRDPLLAHQHRRGSGFRD